MRVVLGQSGRLESWEHLDRVATSVLTETEALRSLDRRWRLGLLDAAAHIDARVRVTRVLPRMHRIPLTTNVLRRAGDPMPTPVGTLDAIHLASALLFPLAEGESLIFATHDKELATAARAEGFEVIGV